MNTMLEKKTNWWSEPMVWLLIALPVSAVIGGMLTIWLAATNADTLVSEDHYKVGFAMHHGAELDRRAAELGMGGLLAATDGKLTLRIEGRLEPQPQTLSLSLSAQPGSHNDMVLKLERMGDMEYAAVYATIPEGPYLLELTPTDKSWRISGQWHAPFTGSTPLAVNQISANPHSSTQP